MRSKKNKIYKARQHAELSLQFYRDRQGTPNFLITSNPENEGKSFCAGIDKLIFARNLVDNSLINDEERTFLCSFFREVERIMKEREEQSKPRRIEIYCNGMVGVFDGKGNQIPSLQGTWSDKKSEILAANKHELVEFFFGTFKGSLIRLDTSSARRLSIEALP